jgi:predicted RNA-binding Zn-ribbon protein involved in translation (DUF1610 family)
MSEPPAKPSEGAGTLNSRIARLRAATGHPERTHLYLRCSGTGKGFCVKFERIDPDGKFEVREIVKEDGGGEADSREAGGTETAKTFPASVINAKNFACPWCASRGIVYHGACATTWCGGAMEKTETGNHFTCPQCRVRFATEAKRELHGFRDGGSSRASRMLGAAASFLRLGKERS